MIYPPIDEGPELYDLTGPGGCSLLPVVAEMRARETARKARAARWRRSWLRRAGAWLRGVLRRGDRPPTGRQAFENDVRENRARGAAALAAGYGQGPGESELQAAVSARFRELGAHGILSVARVAAQHEQRPDLAAAIHSVLLLDMTGNLDDMAALVAAVQEVYRSAPGDNPGAVN